MLVANECPEKCSETDASRRSPLVVNQGAQRPYFDLKVHQCFRLCKGVMLQRRESGHTASHTLALRVEFGVMRDVNGQFILVLRLR